MSKPSSKILLDGKSLKIKLLSEIVSEHNVHVELDRRSLAFAKKTRDFLLDQLLKDKKIIYGINTGFGPMAEYLLSKNKVIELQKNLVRSHATGMGQPLATNYVLAAMVIRLNTLLKGYSGVTPELLEKLGQFINLRLIPLVPEHGAVGTSGDLVQLAHIAINLIGEGELFLEGKITSAATALKKHKLKPHALQAKEGLALINGTAMMSAVAAVEAARAEKLCDLAIALGAWALELVQAYDDGIAEALQASRPHPGQIKVARKLRQLLEGSDLLRNRNGLNHKNDSEAENDHHLPKPVQEVYSLRCIPQILGPILDTLAQAKEVIETEINSATDNPLIDIKNKKILHGGNFHGDYVSSRVDQLKAAMIKLNVLSERRINFFLNSNLNKAFPPFLNLKQPGLNLGLQGLQFVATSTTAQSLSYGYPHHLHSIPTNADNQDVVSMGTDAALFLAKVLDNTEVVLAIELVTLAQATDFLKVEKRLCKSSKKLYDLTRNSVPVVLEDRILNKEIEQLAAKLCQ